MTLMQCTHAPCNGAVEDGFCNVCGMAPPEEGAAAQDTSGTSAGTSGFSKRTGTLTGRLTGTTRTRSATIASSRKMLGAGLVSIAPLPKSDPALAVMKEARVPEHKRECSNCGFKLVKRENGFCDNCRTPYDYRPKLAVGELVADQYEVTGCIAFGGMGWIYLARDTTLGRWVVLKGLLNTSDPTLAAAAVAERQFLAEVNHANIVKIYTFVQHKQCGYIVMEYVGGRTIKSIRKERGPLPVTEAIAYLHRSMPAFAYMHQEGLVYCDFKPDNLMLDGDDIKVIDLGGVRRLASTEGDVFGTAGFAAPEVAQVGPSVSSDLYTIGRTLALLVTDFIGYQDKYEFSLPTPVEMPFFREHESLYRFLQKACHKEPEKRFQSADEFADQLLGVMREEAAREGVHRNIESTIFGGDVLALRDLSQKPVEAIGVDLLPSMKKNLRDPATEHLLLNLSADPKKQTAALQQLCEQFPDSLEAKLALARNYILLGDAAAAEQQIAEAAALPGADYRTQTELRINWYRGMLHLAGNRAKEALECFQACYTEVPGELAPQLALGLAYEALGDDTAAVYYDRTAGTDETYITSVFGLARCLLKAGNRAEAVNALERVPQMSSLFTEGQKAAVRALIDDAHTAPSAVEVAQAAEIVERLTADEAEKTRLRAEVLDTALITVKSSPTAQGAQGNLFGQAFTETGVRTGLEKALRDLARLSRDPQEKVVYVDRANAVRPKSFV